MFLKYQVKSLVPSPLIDKKIDKANKIVFALFTRYGDTLINLAVIKEFIEKYPNKEYLILAPKQMTPYIEHLLPSIRYIGLNKRNLYDMIKIHIILKKEKFDVGFNPWSNGLESYFFISYAKYYFPYREFDKPKLINHYDIVRKYMGLKEKEWHIKEFILENNYNNILICPESTDEERSLSVNELNRCIKRFHSANITIAAMDTKYFNKNSQKFIFKKSASSSRAFIALMKKNDLIICVDSAPLHLAVSLKKKVIAIFTSTNERYVLNTNSMVTIKNIKDL
jgi:ADP-heptose:LPS heptosyltransferase